MGIFTDYLQNSTKTKLSPFVEAIYQNEKTSNNINDDDYDMRGYFQEYGSVKPMPSFYGNGHYPDTYKDPKHMTFSTGSKYNGVLTPQGIAQGGRWEQLQDGNWNFYASPFNLMQYSPQEMQNYFNKYEIGNGLIFPY